MQIQPYLFFEGRCQEAIDFYSKALGAETTMLMHFKDAPDSGSRMAPGSENKVMHASIRIGDTTILASDGHCGGAPSFQGFGLSLSAADDAEAQRLFSVLAEGGEVRMALDKTFFASSFGMVSDRFGVLWMIIAAA